MSSSSISPITTFVDDPAGWLDYLARRLRTSVAARWLAAEVVVVGRYRADSAEIIVAEVLKGKITGESIRLALPEPEGTDAYPSVPVPANGDLTLAFLAGAEADGERPPLSVPGALLFAAEPDRWTAELQTARWCAALPDDRTARAAAVATAVPDEDRTRSASALTLIADEQLDNAAGAVQDLAGSDDPYRASLAASALWLLGREGDAVAAFDAMADRVGRDQLLDLWQVRASDDSEDPQILWGPDPESPWSR